MTRPRSALRDATPAHRIRAADNEAARYQDFLDLHGLEPDAHGVVLYLTALQQQPDQTGQGLRRALARLDLAAALEGHEPPSHMLDVKLFLRGAHRFSPLGPAVPRCDPLYREQVRLLIEQATRPNARQLRDIACLLIVNGTGVRYPQIRHLSWSDVRLTKHAAHVSLPIAEPQRFTLNATADPRVSAPYVLRALRSVDGPGDGPLLAQRGDTAGPMRYRLLLRSIGATGRTEHHAGQPWVSSRQLVRAVAPLWRLNAAALRDRALIVLAFLGALTNIEAATLTVRDIQVTQSGLLLRLPYRPTPQIGLPTGADERFCPVHAWTTWLAHYRPNPQAPAFPRLRPMGARISHEHLTETGLSEIVKQHAASLGLEGSYTFSSLRIGFIRTAIRDDVPAPLIAQHAGLRQLRTIEHERAREHILTGGAVTRVGL